MVSLNAEEAQRPCPGPHRLVCALRPGRDRARHMLLPDDPSATLLGLPAPFAWNIGWVLGTFFAMLSYHLITQRRQP